MTQSSETTFFSDAAALLPQLFSGAAEMLFLVDTDLTIHFYNDTARKQTQKQRGIALQKGMCILELAKNDTEANFFKTTYAAVFAGATFESPEVRRCEIDDTCYQYLIRPVKTRAGAVIAALITAYDATQKCATEQALKESEERLRFAMEGSNHGIWDWRINTGEIYFSPSWMRLLGFDDGDIENKIEEWETRVHPEDKAQLARDLHSHFHSPKPTYENTYRLQAKDGTYKWIMGRGKIVERAPDGTPLRMIGTHTDITEKRDSEEQYRNLFDLNPLPTWIYDFDTLQFLAVNQAAINHYGFSRAEFLKMRIPDIHPENQSERFQEALKKRDKNPKSTYTNWKHRKKNGEVMIVEMNSITIDYSGRKARLVVTNDVTNKVASDTELRQSHQRFQYVTKATSDAIYDYDISTGTIAWGEGLMTLFGHVPNEIMIAQWETNIHADEREAVMHSIRCAIHKSRKKFWKMEYRFLKKDGTYRYVIDKGFILRAADDKPLRMIGAMQDITNFKQKQLELLESNQRYEFATLAVSEIIWDWDLKNNRVLWSDNYEKLMGWKLPTDKYLSLETCLERFHATDRERIFESLSHAVANKEQTTWDGELKYLKADGGFAYIYNRCYILRNAKGEAERVIGAMQDITHRKHLEEQLLQKELDKQKVISKATIDTQERERSEIGKELHDNVNQVLTTTKLYLELAMSQPELKDDLLQKSQQNIMYVINEIRQLSRSLMNPSLGDLGLFASVNDLIEDIRATRKLKVYMQGDETLEHVLSGNLSLTIYRIIQEALNNAVKHAQASTVSVLMRQHNGRVEVTIKDDGTGFDPEVTKKGAGLKNIQNRVYLIDGTLQIWSAPGNGTTLRIQFTL